MSNKIDLVKQFYDALNRGDYKFVNRLYHSDARYKDEIFDFQGAEIHALWYSATRPEMKLFAKLESIHEENDKVVTEWIMTYTLDVINRRISLREKGTFVFQGEKIIKHTDEYDFWSWCTQAFGIIGRALGWSVWLQNRVKKQARKSVLAQLYSSQGLLNSERTRPK